MAANELEADLTLVAVNHWQVAIDTHSLNRRTRSIDAPLSTVTGKIGEGIITPFMISYYGTSDASSIDNPLPTATTKDRFGIVTGRLEQCFLDIHFRMFTPREQARGQGFPDDYKFQGTKSDMVKQIGNAVPVGLAKSLIASLLADYAPKQKAQNVPVLLTKAAAACEARA
jgi:DNA (cytosine-5)-methyltransferase 1